MKKILLVFMFAISYPMAMAQLNITNNAIQAQPVLNQAMVIQVGARKIEVMMNLRALSLGGGKYQLINSDSTYSSAVYGVAYDHTQKAYIFLTGDISYKLLAKNGLSTLASSIALRSRLIANPDTYVLNVNNPLDVVSFFKDLKSNQAVEWVEVFTLQGVVN